MLFNQHVQNLKDTKSWKSLPRQRFKCIHTPRPVRPLPLPLPHCSRSKSLWGTCARTWEAAHVTNPLGLGPPSGLGPRSGLGPPSGMGLPSGPGPPLGAIPLLWVHVGARFGLEPVAHVWEQHNEQNMHGIIHYKKCIQMHCINGYNHIVDISMLQI